MTHTIACRPGCFELPLTQALVELKRAGVDNVELDAPADGNYTQLATLAKDSGLAITSLSIDAQVDNLDQMRALDRAIAGAQAIGVPIIFLAASLKQSSYEDGLALLKAPAERARSAGVILSLETHVPFAHNGATARRTVEAVGSAGLGYNYDSANIYYYNPKGIDTVAELTTALPYVSSVHLKESAHGEPESFDFPVFGEGIVNFPAVFATLDAHGYAGPYTMELEGPLVDGLPVAERSAKVRACLDYLKSIGACA